MLIGRSTVEFVRHWYGDPARDPIVRPGDVPLALREWWAYEDAWETPITRQNRVLPAGDVYGDDNRTVFYVENQAVWLWAYGEGNEPQVYDRENEARGQWEPVDETLRTFLHHVAVFEAVLGAEYALTANNLDGSVVASILQTLPPSPFVDWRWPGPRSNVREGDGCLVFASVNDRPGSGVDETSPWMLYVAGRTADALSAFDAFRITWDFESR